MTAPAAYPLAWPAGWPRTEPHAREWGQFKVGYDAAVRELGFEVERLGGRYMTISTNAPVRRDGYPYADALKRSEDPGVAVYFERRGRQMCFACDSYDRIWKNIRAIGKTIEAIRAIERYGATDMMERSLTAFEALPPPAGWRTVLGFAVDAGVRLEDAERRYRDLVKRHHPDAGGDPEQFRKLNDAIGQAREELG